MHSSAAINREATLKKQTNKKTGATNREREVENKNRGVGARGGKRGGRAAGAAAAAPNQREEGGYQLYARIPRDDEYMIPTNS